MSWVSAKIVEEYILELASRLKVRRDMMYCGSICARICCMSFASAIQNQTHQSWQNGREEDRKDAILQ